MVPSIPSRLGTVGEWCLGPEKVQLERRRCCPGPSWTHFQPREITLLEFDGPGFTFQLHCLLYELNYSISLNPGFLTYQKGYVSLSWREWWALQKGMPSISLSIQAKKVLKDSGCWVVSMFWAKWDTCLFISLPCFHISAQAVPAAGNAFLSVSECLKPACSAHSS